MEDGERKTPTWSGGCHGRGEEERGIRIWGSRNLPLYVGEDTHG
jgi:hypothetical protein